MGLKSFIIKMLGGNEPKASYIYRDYRNITPMIYDGEKTPYELGNPKNLILDYYSLRARSWQAYIESDVVQNAIKKYVLWIIGSGLKLQAQPVENILEKSGVTKESIDNFIKEAESLFRLYSNENYSTYNGMQSLHSMGAEALKNALLSGDVLCINRFDSSNVTMEIIDGVHVKTPLDQKELERIKARGNKIVEGVEVNSKNTHIAYYISDGKRIEARGRKTKRLKAWLFYGLKHKISDVRGLSLLNAILETVSKMDRYKDATVGAAEENAKIPYTIEHLSYSTGENPLINNVIQSMGKGKGIAPETKSYEDCESGGYATKIAQSTSKQTYNLPNGAKLMRHAGSTDINFKEFFGINIDIIYTTLGIPPEVARDQFSGAYSGSRAALKSWDYKMLTDRNILLKDQFYKPFYNFWLDIQILQGNINAPGYQDALLNKDLITLSAYRNARFIGATVPHIDPLKEVNAERRKLGKSFDNIPLTTIEQSTEALNTGDSDQVIKKAQDEKESAKYFDAAVFAAPGNGTIASQVSRVHRTQ